jgi:tRNA threonylcarbamoyladenosine biosynthesis protein TsaE
MPIMDTIISHSEAETQDCGRQLAAELLPRLSQSAGLVAIRGELGAGKTQLVKGLAAGFGLTNTIQSPTYNLVHEYPLPASPAHRLVHIDTWRLENPADIQKIGIKQYLEHGDWIMWEWAPQPLPTELIPAGVPVINVTLIANEAAPERQISINYSA